MKLSDLIMVGQSLVKGDPHKWLTMDGSCGCALGGAIVAAGALNEFALDGSDPYDNAAIRRLWPWLTADHLNTISALYHAAFYGMWGKTLEDVCAYVRSIEPAEPEPLPEEEFTDEPAELAIQRYRS